MERQALVNWQEIFRRELLDNVMPFWMEYGWDRQNGGVHTYLARDGQCCSTIKSVWAQGRFLWMLSYLSNTYGADSQWLAAAASCKRFLEGHCVDRDGRMFFLVTDEGQPVRKRRYYFSEAFFTIGLAEYAKASGDMQSLDQARAMFDFILRIYLNPQSDPHQVYPKYEPQAGQWRALGGPMIMLNVSSIMRRCDPKNAATYDQGVRQYIADLLTYHYNEQYACLFENVALDGAPILQTPQGRLVNPGHCIEAAWFLLDEAEYFQDAEIRNKALRILEWSLQLGWDQQYGGLYYFVDRLGFAPEQYEHDMKLWWPQVEAIIATLKAYQATGDVYWFAWFEKLSHYAFEYFKDQEYPEWAGYLHRDNSKQLPIAKGNYFKGPFHLPRMLAVCGQTLEQLIQRG